MLWILAGALFCALLGGGFLWLCLVETENALERRTQQTADMAAKAARAERARASVFEAFQLASSVAARLGEEREAIELLNERQYARLVELKDAIREHESTWRQRGVVGPVDTALWAVVDG